MSITLFGKIELLPTLTRLLHEVVLLLIIVNADIKMPIYCIYKVMHIFPISPSLLYSNEACKVCAFIFNLQVLKLSLKNSEIFKVTLRVK